MVQLAAPLPLDGLPRRVAAAAIRKLHELHRAVGADGRGTKFTTARPGPDGPFGAVTSGG